MHPKDHVAGTTIAIAGGAARARAGLARNARRRRPITAKEWTGGAMAAAAVLVVAAAPAQAANWPTFNFDNARTGYNRSEVTLGTGNVGTLVNQWNQSVGEFGGSFSSDAYVFAAEKNVLFGPGSDFRSIAALNISDGSVKWQTDIVTSDNDIDVSTPAVASGVVYIGANYLRSINGVNDAMYAISERNGTVLWASPSACNSEITSPTTVAEGLVYFGDGAGAITALSASTGALVWAAGNTACISGGGNYTGAASYAVNRTLGNVLYIGFADYTKGTGNYTAYNAGTGSVLWSTPMGPVSAAGAIGAGKVFVNSADGNFYALNDTTGAVVWKFAPSGGVGYGSPAYANGVVYVTDDSSDLYALNARKGTVLWEAAGAAASNKEPVVANGVVYTAVGGDGLKAFDASNGNALFSQGIGCWAMNGEPVVVNGAVYQVGFSTCGDSNDLLAKWGLP